MQRVLITGITGFAGSHLAEYLLTMPDIELYGIRRWRSRTEFIDHISNNIKTLECDLRDQTSVTNIIREIKPDKIFHLAAQSFVPTSWHAPGESLTTNIIGNLNIFEAVRHLNINPWTQVACSSEEYGMVYPDELPIKETNPLRPLSPYAVSKVGQDFLSYQYYMSYKLNVVRTRGFNHTGPRRGEVFVSSDFAKQIVEIEMGKREPVIYVGNLEAIRDFTDVRDMVRGYWLALEKGMPGEVYNICSGKGYKIREILEILLSMSDKKVEVRVDETRLRPSDVPVLIGDYTKFRQQTGWEPTIPFKKTMEDLLNYWREKLAGR
ncbi:MAG: GDP-mannose 4,6-dehydratase [Nitrospinae bacterium RIFCSPLOWO2_12_FULL_45_22]|nr:MAG: GDP-mannose 4,6-dehydratase [Nitrospinae bacterium RIFCSPLOWO2_12_FULL_45_22]